MTTSGRRLAESIVLDSSAYHHLRAGDERVATLMAAASLTWLPAIVLGELEAGFAMGTRARENRQRLEELLEEPTVGVLPVDDRVAARYGLLRAELRRAGTPVATNDVWIAATTLQVGGHLVTFDRDFERIPDMDMTLLARR
jgi:tRNA(fMet)-specific endonuclease VapC